MATKVSHVANATGHVWVCGTVPYEKEVSSKVEQSIREAFPNMWEGILKDLQYDFTMRCFFFTRDDVFFGVEEKDGYIHT